MVIKYIDGKRGGDEAGRRDGPEEVLDQVVSGEMTAGDINRLYRTILGNVSGSCRIESSRLASERLSRQRFLLAAIRLETLGAR
jgi:hypothetical protein